MTYEELLEKAVKPHAAELAEITRRAEVAVIGYVPLSKGVKTLHALGWKVRPVFGVSRARMQTYAADTVDLAWQSWAGRPSNEDCLRILLVANFSNLLINSRPERGYEIEHESLDELSDADFDAGLIAAMRVGKLFAHCGYCSRILPKLHDWHCLTCRGQLTTADLRFSPAEEGAVDEVSDYLRRRPPLALSLRPTLAINPNLCCGFQIGVTG